MKQQFASLARIGFVYNTRIIRVDGSIEEETTHNIMPTEALNDLLGVWLKSGTQSPNWYLTLFEGNYFPDSLLTAANFASVATECTAYNPSSRVAWIPGTVNAGAVDNGASRGVFTMTAPKTVYGGALLSSSTKGGTTGKLGSAVRFSSPKVLGTGDQLSVAAGISLIST